MHIKRLAEGFLLDWKKETNPKPLLLRGARQVGKSTLVRNFAKNYKFFVELNLEKPNDKRYFKEERDIKTVWQEILFNLNLPNDPQNTLLFIDEIQEIPFVIKQLRYFYEDLPQLNVIAAGSLLEFALGKVTSFPVGRIEEYTLHPFNFEEFLIALGEEQALKELKTVPVNTYAYQKLYQLFDQYIIIGGMPEVVKHFVENNKSMVGLKRIYNSIWSTYQNDVVKYAKNNTQMNVLRHILNEAAKSRDRISFTKFGNSEFKSREMGEGFNALDLCKLIYLIYPTTQITAPTLPDTKRRPRLQLLDTGLLNFVSGIQTELMQLNDLSDYYRGFLISHVLYQELISYKNQSFQKPMFWVKENPAMNAEVDLTHQYKNELIPVEIKSGASGSLRSLHEFMDLVPHKMAVRFLKNELSQETVNTKKNKSFTLLNLPYFAISQLDSYLDWAFGKK